LPADLFVHHKAAISAVKMFTLWNTLEQMTSEHELQLLIG